MSSDLKDFLKVNHSSLEKILARTEDWGLEHHGWATLAKPLSFDFYRTWLNENRHGDMIYLENHAAVKENPTIQWPKVKTALVFSIPYYPHPEKISSFPLQKARVSLYAQGRDYHHWFRERMQELITLLKNEFPDDEFFALTDNAPVLERDLAYRASLGWVGKNTCLIHPKRGSLFFIGEIYTSLQVEQVNSPLPDFCGTCRRCIDICPTQAITEERKLDARRCISYLTIESRKVADTELREKIGDWLFGCDLCQTTCPWNQKVFKNQLSTEKIQSLSDSESDELESELRYLLKSSGKKLERDFVGTALSRAGSFGLKRNALVVIGNRKMRGLESEVQAFLDHPKLGELARWTLEKIRV